MHRSHTCGALRQSDVNKYVQLAGWVQRIRDKGFVLWIDLRDRYGVTQLVLDEERCDATLVEQAKTLGREFVVQVHGRVIEREAKNSAIPTGDVEVLVNELSILSPAETPPFTLEDETDGGDDLRMKYRYLDIRRNPIKDKLLFRNKVAQVIRNYLSSQDFAEIETPYLIKSTPEGARDFVVPSRMNPGQFYALPQSPQTFKQLLMVGGMDRYYQIVKCFRDEDLRADRQPEFTQIDCEMAFVEQDDILAVFEGLLQQLLEEIHGITPAAFPRITYAEAIATYGSDKPDVRFRMHLAGLNSIAQGKGFQVFDQQEWVGGFAVDGGAEMSRKEIDHWIDWVKRPQIGAKGMVWVKCITDGSYKSSVDKFYSQEDLATWASACQAKAGDIILVLSGGKAQTQSQLGELRLAIAEKMGLRDPKVFAPLWVVDFPLFEQEEGDDHFHAMHHPFTAPKPEQVAQLDNSPETVFANAYDLVLNGNEIGGGSIRIHDREIQEKMFSILGFNKQEADAQFGFLMDAFRYGAPPHGGIALGFDRLVAVLDGQESIRDYIAFPKNNSGRDVMIDAPATLDDDQLDELSLQSKA